MISKKEAFNKTANMDTKTASLVMIPRADVDILLDEIYDSIGSCGECVYYNEGYCDKSRQTWVVDEDHVYDEGNMKVTRNHFCADFERKQS